MKEFNQEKATSDRARAGSRQSEEAQVIAVVEGINAAFRAKDLDKIMSFYAEDVVAYDMMPPLEFNGKNAYRKAWKMGLDWTSEVGPFEDAHRRIHVSGDLAVFHCLCHMTGTSKKEEEKFDMWSRYTGVLKKTADQWLVVHEQFSAPIDMETQKAVWDLKPEAGVIH